jgi:deoxyribonuclease-4
MWKAKPIIPDEAVRFHEKRDQLHIGPAVIHMPYLPNFASPNPILHSRSTNTLSEEVTRAATLGCEMIVAHMGSHLGKGREHGLTQVVKTLRAVLDPLPTTSTPSILLENTAGYTNSVGDTFEDLAYVIDALDGDQRVGICFDTCHGFAAGYDLSNEAAVTATFEELESQLGLNRLKLLHLNDSKGKLGTHLDRHEHIGKGYIGVSGFRAILNLPSLRGLPMILETPNNPHGNMKTNLGTLRSLLG